jgi:hypothetical protein
MKNLLKRLRLNRIDLVDVPANPGAEVMIVKRYTEDEPMADKNTDPVETPAVDEPVSEPTAAVVEKDDAVAKRLVELEKRAQESEAREKKLQEEIAKRNEAEEVRVFVEKATGLEGFGDATVFGPIYRKIHKTLNDEARATIDRVFGSLSEVVKQSAVFTEAGDEGASTVDASADPYTQIQKKAAAKYPDMDEPAAIRKYLDTPEGKDLYRKYTESKER